MTNSWNDLFCRKPILYNMYLCVLQEGKDDVLEHELAVADRKNKREIRNLEQELPKWQVLVDSVTGESLSCTI